MVEGAIVTLSGVIYRPPAGAEIEFPLPEVHAKCVVLSVVVAGRRLPWARLEGGGRMTRAFALRKLAQRRYLEDGARLDACELLGEIR
jgi:hypothetical protein